MMPPLAALQRRLTAWYVGVFALILILFGGAMLWTVTRQVSRQLDRSLDAAVGEVVRAARIREAERGLPAGQVVDALEELRIPERRLYLFDEQGGLIHPGAAESWVRSAALQALRSGRARSAEHVSGHDWRLVARRFQLDGQVRVAVAAADVIELEDEYLALITAFTLAATAALILVGFGGAVLARRSTRPVEDAFAEMRRFMADAAHELRTPLAIVRGHAEEGLRPGRTEEERATALATILRESERLCTMVENLLLLARAQSEGMRPRPEPMYLDDALLDVAGSARILAADRNVELTADGLEEAPALADPALVRQVLLIIVDNAIQYAPPASPVRLEAGVDEVGPFVAVEDRGPGISVDALPRVTDPFFRADPARGRRGGAGLGLAIARSIVDAHGGSLGFQQPDGGGTRVVVRFPRIADAA